jgi:DNA-binding NarL/FixJ family response regulator
VLKESAPEDLVECVRRVHRGESWIDRGAEAADAGTRPAPSASTPPVPTPFTPRELEIVRMLARGLRNRDIATRLAISEGTVKIHLHNVYEKVGVDGRIELLLYAQQQRLL